MGTRTFIDSRNVSAGLRIEEAARGSLIEAYSRRPTEDAFERRRVSLSPQLSYRPEACGLPAALFQDY